MYIKHIKITSFHFVNFSHEVYININIKCNLWKEILERWVKVPT